MFCHNELLVPVLIGFPCLFADVDPGNNGMGWISSMLGWWSYCFPNTIGLVGKKCKSGHWNSSYFPSDPLSSSLKKKRGTWNLKNPRLMILQQGIWSLGGIPPTLDPSMRCTTPASSLTCHGAYQTVPGMHNDAYPGGLSGVIPQISLNIYLIIEISSLQLRSWLCGYASMLKNGFAGGVSPLLIQTHMT